MRRGRGAAPGQAAETDARAGTHRGGSLLAKFRRPGRRARRQPACSGVPPLPPLVHGRGAPGPPSRSSPPVPKQRGNARPSLRPRPEHAAALHTKGRAAGPAQPPHPAAPRPPHRPAGELRCSARTPEAGWALRAQAALAPQPPPAAHAAAAPQSSPLFCVRPVFRPRPPPCGRGPPGPRSAAPRPAPRLREGQHPRQG